MNEGELDFTLERLFVAFGSAIAGLLLLFTFRVLRVFFLGKRYRGVIARVRITGNRRQRNYSYVVEYEDGLRGKRLAYERQETPLREFGRGDAVTIYVKEGEPPVCEILSWTRVLFSLGVILVVVMILVASYLYCMRLGWVGPLTLRDLVRVLTLSD